jgi:putative endonuclease
MDWQIFTSNKQVGDQFELLACNYLCAQGLELLCRNFHCRLGEIDLIMRDNQQLVFVEVKYRRSTNFGGAIYAVSHAKQTKLTKSATFYLQQQNLNAYNTPLRFDVVAITGNINAPHVQWIKDAFTGA